jgi:hypothetical protein
MARVSHSTGGERPARLPSIDLPNIFRRLPRERMLTRSASRTLPRAETRQTAIAEPRSGLGRVVPMVAAVVALGVLVQDCKKEELNQPEISKPDANIASCITESLRELERPDVSNNQGPLLSAAQIPQPNPTGLPPELTADEKRSLLQSRFGMNDDAINLKINAIAKVTKRTSGALDILYAFAKKDITEKSRIENYLKEISQTAGNFSPRIFKMLPRLLSYGTPENLLMTIKSIQISRFYEHNLEEIIGNRVKNQSDGRPLAVIVFPNPRADWNGAFNRNKQVFADLISQGYRIMYYEATIDSDFFNSLKETTQPQKARILIIGGHGNQNLINFGDKRRSHFNENNLPNEQYYLDVLDREEANKHFIRFCIEDQGQVVLFSCSTGEGTFEEVNVANFIRDIFPQAKNVWALTLPGWARGIIFDENGRIKTIKYTSGDRVRNISYDAMEEVDLDAIIEKVSCPPKKQTADPWWRYFMPNEPIEIIYNEQYIENLIQNLREKPPYAGIPNRSVAVLLCMYKSGEENIRQKIVSLVIEWLDNPGGLRDTAKLILRYAGMEAVPGLVERLQHSREPLNMLERIAQEQGSDPLTLINNHWKEEYAISSPEVIQALMLNNRVEYVPKMFEIYLNDYADKELREKAKEALRYFPTSNLIVYLNSNYDSLIYDNKDLKVLGFFLSNPWYDKLDAVSKIMWDHLILRILSQKVKKGEPLGNLLFFGAMIQDEYLDLAKYWEEINLTIDALLDTQIPEMDIAEEHKFSWGFSPTRRVVVENGRIGLHYIAYSSSGGSRVELDLTTKELYLSPPVKVTGKGIKQHYLRQEQDPKEYRDVIEKILFTIRNMVGNSYDYKQKEQLIRVEIYLQSFLCDLNQ